MPGKDVREVGGATLWTRIRTAVTTDDEDAMTPVVASCHSAKGPFTDFLVEGTWNSKTIDVMVVEMTDEYTVPGHDPAPGETGSGITVPGCTSGRVEAAFKDGSSKLTLSEDRILPMCSGRGYVTLEFFDASGAVSLDVWARDS